MTLAIPIIHKTGVLSQNLSTPIRSRSEYLIDQWVHKFAWTCQTSNFNNADVAVAVIRGVWHFSFKFQRTRLLGE